MSKILLRSPRLPRNPHIDALKKQAKQLFKEHQSAQPEAAQRIRAFMPDLRAASDQTIFQTEFTLQAAQCVLAREHGFGNWVQLSEAVETIRRADSDLLPRVDTALQEGQPIHVLVASHITEDIAQRLAAHCGGDRVILMPRKDWGPLDAWLSRLEAADVVVGCPDALAFPTMYERLEKPEGPRAFEELLARTHAFLNVRRRDECTPLIISGPDGETDGSRDLISMYLTEFYGLYGSITDHRY
jgi:hypothetical protein